MSSKDSRDIVGGLVLTAIGVAAAAYAQVYDFGTLNRMGPGYFPAVLGLLLAALGLLVAIPAFLRRGEPVQIEWKTFALVMISLVTFALTLKSLGLVFATALAVIISSLADRETRWKGRLVLAAGAAAVTYLIFSLGLSMVLPVWPWSY